MSRCWIDLVPDLTGLVKDAWFVTDFGFPLLSAVECQMRTTGARGLSEAMSDTEHIRLAHLLGRRRTQDVLQAFLTLSMG